MNILPFDLFCRVVDNFGDAGVCWRLARRLAALGQPVRLWIDRPEVLARLLPALDVQAGEQVLDGVRIAPWHRAEQAMPPRGGVVVEAFACDLPPAYEAAMAGRDCLWINLEYLSAQDYVERSHGLRSPVWSGAAKGLHKRFFYPGFTPATGGLLREPGLIAQREIETGPVLKKQQLLRQIGLQLPPDAPLVLLFCYDTAPVGALLGHLAVQAPKAHVLLTPGAASQLAQAWAQANPAFAGHLHELPAMPQADFDRLLWCCDLNLVRGEDSAVRALWAGRPHMWQIYEQDDGVHAAKLEAFMARWHADWPDSLRAEVRAWWLAWNRLGPMPERLPDWLSADLTQSTSWRTCSEKARARLLAQQDLTSQLLNFVASSG